MPKKLEQKVTLVTDDLDGALKGGKKEEFLALATVETRVSKGRRAYNK